MIMKREGLMFLFTVNEESSWALELGLGVTVVDRFDGSDKVVVVVEDRFVVSIQIDKEAGIRISFSSQNLSDRNIDIRDCRNNH